MTSPVQVIADQLGLLLQRDTRAGIYGELTAGIESVSATTYPVLSGIARIGPTTVTQLAGTIGLDRTVVTKYAAKLTAHGLLRRSSDPTDGRSVRIELTEAGAAAVRTMRARLTAVLGRATADWATADVEQLGTLLERLISALPTDANPAKAGLTAR